jgi:hypothetical protein
MRKGHRHTGRLEIACSAVNRLIGRLELASQMCPFETEVTVRARDCYVWQPRCIEATPDFNRTINSRRQAVDAGIAHIKPG